MTNQNTINLLAISLTSILLVGCAGGAETTIIETKSVVETPTNSGNSQGSNSNDFLIDSMGRLDITELDVATMPEGASFALTVSKNDNHVYVSDPMAQHILQVYIETLSIAGDMEVDFVPASMVWLGIAAESYDHP